jgi:hypothetical protein
VVMTPFILAKLGDDHIDIYTAELRRP